MKVLNLLTSGEAGGIETLCRDIGANSSFENAFCFLFGSGKICDQMKEMGLLVYELGAVGGKLSIRKLRKLISIAKQYDIIVVHHGDIFLKMYHILVCALLGKKGVTVVHSCYEKKLFFPQSKWKRILGKTVFQLGINISQLVIFVSEAGKKSYETFFRLQENKTAIVYNGIGTDKIELGKQAYVNLGKPYNITYIGRLSVIKGVDLLIKAVSMLSEKYPLQLSIVGDGADRKRLEKLTEKLQLQNITNFYGRQVDVVPYLQKASVFVYASTCQEVFGIALVEAMAFGRPCVANRVGGIPEIMQDGVTGFFSDEPTAEGIARAIERAISCIESGAIEQMSECIKQNAENFSICKTVDQLQMQYEKLMQRK